MGQTTWSTALETASSVGLRRIPRGHCVSRVHAARSQPWARIGGLPYGNPDTPAYQLSCVTFESAYYNAWCVRLRLLRTPSAVTRDPASTRPRPLAQATPRHSMPPAGGVWVAPRPPGTAGPAGRPGSPHPAGCGSAADVPLTRQPGSAPAIVRPPVYPMCVHHGQRGSPVSLAVAARRAVDRLRCLTFSPGLAVAARRTWRGERATESCLRRGPAAVCDR